jgi:ferredoxin
MSDLKIIIDRTKCTGEAICVGIAPEVFELDEDGIAVVMGAEGADREAILEAAESCPADAIIVIDEKSGEKLAA